MPYLFRRKFRKRNLQLPFAWIYLFSGSCLTYLGISMLTAYNPTIERLVGYILIPIGMFVFLYGIFARKPK